jgi:hypothetical protein
MKESDANSKRPAVPETGDGGKRERADDMENDGKIAKLHKST